MPHRSIHVLLVQYDGCLHLRPPPYSTRNRRRPPAAAEKIGMKHTLTYGAGRGSHLARLERALDCSLRTSQSILDR